MLSLVPPLVELLKMEADVPDDIPLKTPELTDEQIAGWMHGPLTIARYMLESGRS
ncbi:hypothetical protein [Streptomyces luteireticuli]|uniref:Uncharacterized protein n=1 Tax=Streptomyces luteireticuli TaxID=173858 RepID=A0ABP3ITL7_9ACTN